MSNVITPYCRSGNYVRIEDNCGVKSVTKRLSQQELSAYNHLEPYRECLGGGSPRVIIPQLVDFDDITGIARLSYIGDLPSLEPMQYFGLYERYGEDYFRKILGAFTSVRELMPVTSFPYRLNYEENSTSNVRFVLEQKVACKRGEDIRNKIAVLATNTFEQIASRPLFASHRDPNPNNYLVPADECTVGIIDWETFGLSRSGYDEARLMSYLALSTELQEMYLDICGSTNVQSDNDKLYFWQTAGVRVLRSLALLDGGKYDSRFRQPFEKEHIRSAFLLLTERCISEWEIYLR